MHNGLSVKGRIEEHRNDGGIGMAGGLQRSVDVEEPERKGRIPNES